MMVESSTQSKQLSKALIIYGEPAVGKSTLDLNLRRFYGFNLTENHWQSDGRRCFLGKTAKRGGRLMSTGGAEAMITLPPDIPDTEWYIAALPVSGRGGVEVTTEFLLRRVNLFYAICLHSENSTLYRGKRVEYFSGRPVKMIGKERPSKPRLPSYVPRDRCKFFTTEDMLSAMRYGIDLLGPNAQGDLKPVDFSLLEEFDPVPPQGKLDFAAS